MRRGIRIAVAVLLAGLVPLQAWAAASMTRCGAPAASTGRPAQLAGERAMQAAGHCADRPAAAGEHLSFPAEAPPAHGCACALCHAGCGAAILVALELFQPPLVAVRNPGTPRPDLSIRAPHPPPPPRS